MGGLLHLFDFHQGHSRRKQKKKGNVGLDDPQNSSDLPAETGPTLSSVGDCEKDSPRRSYYPVVASTKKFINEGISNRSSDNQNAPSVVAKLMGMDASSEDTPDGQSLKGINTKARVIDKEARQIEKVSALRFSKKSKSSKKERQPCKDANFRHLSSGTNIGKSEPRVHPQEQELQKFKKDFEAWQAARFLECARIVDLGNIPDKWLAELDLTKEKMAIYETSRKEVLEKSIGCKTDMFKSRSFHGGDFDYLSYKKEALSAEHKETSSFSSRCSSRDFEQLSLKDSDQNSDKSSSVPSRIVVFKPGPDSFCANEESWIGSSCSMEDRDCIEDLLEEVKLRLKVEMQGKTFQNGSMVRGGGIETPFKEKPANRKQTSQPVKKQVKENISRELIRKLFRSESTRSYQNEFQVDELAPSSPEFMRRDESMFLGSKLARSESARLSRTGFHISELAPSSPEMMNINEREFLDRKLRRSESARIYQTESHFNELGPSSPEYMSRTTKNVMLERLSNGPSRENYQNLPNNSDELSRGPWFDNARDRLEKARDILNAQARSFKHEMANVRDLSEQPSPRNLARSMSAPVSGISFGKLLLEDRYISTGAHSKRKHEAPEKLSANAKGQRKERFNFREKVSNIKCSLSLRKKLLSQKLQSVDFSQRKGFDSPQDMMSRPAIITGFRYRNENSTEVPPSPASVCSTPREEFWKITDNPSPLSNSCVTSFGDHGVNDVFRDISSNLTELRKQLNQLDYEASEMTTLTEEPSEAEVEDEGEAYIKHLLVASGLYNGSWDKSFSRYDPYTNPLGNWVFEKVEGSYKEQVANDNDDDERMSDHKLLFDLLNEALVTVLGPPRTMSKYRRNISEISQLPLPRGIKLLSRVWHMICEYLNPPIIDSDSYSLDDLVAHDLDFMPWSNLIDEQISGMGKELECQIVGELIQELVMEIQL